jgi:hypothetical protein
MAILGAARRRESSPRPLRSLAEIERRNSPLPPPSPQPLAPDVVAVDILISADVRADLDERYTLHAVPPADVKGESEPIVTCAVVGRA